MSRPDELPTSLCSRATINPAIAGAPAGCEARRLFVLPAGRKGAPRDLQADADAASIDGLARAGGR